MKLFLLFLLMLVVSIITYIMGYNDGRKDKVTPEEFVNAFEAFLEDVEDEETPKE